MNLQCTAPMKPLRVFILNALLPSSQMLAEKILSGAVFGQDQKINLLFLVHDDELRAAEALKIELENCGYGCTNNIQYSMIFPRLEDADVFCFMTNLANPNYVKFQDTDENEDDHVALRFLMTVGNNITNVPIIVEQKSDEPVLPAVKKKEIEDRCKHEPLFVCDGLVTMNILYQCCNDVPFQLFFCSTPLENIAKMVLGDYLKVLCDKINHSLVWAANDEVFHIEVLKPVIMDKNVPDSACDREVINKIVLDKLNMDHTQFSASWMKKEFIDKVKHVALKNPYGPVYKASAFANTLKTIWASKRGSRKETMYANIGAISNGTCETIKGGSYILPLILKGGCWSLNKSFETDCFVRHELKRINKTVRQNMETVKDYCRLFFATDESGTTSSSSRTYSSKSSTTFSSRT